LPKFAFVLIDSEKADVCSSFLSFVFEQEGEQQIRDFLGKVAEVQLDEMDDEQVMKTLQSLRKQVEGSSNAYLKDIIAGLD